MANEYDKESGRIMVPIDLRTEVIRPMRALEEKFEHLDGRVTDHINAHTEEKVEADARRAKRKRAIKWLLSAGGTAGASSLAYAIQQMVTS